MNSIETLKTKSDLHIARKVWHTIGVLLLFLILKITNHINALQAFMLFAAFSLLIDVLRQLNPNINKFTVSLFKFVMRKSEEKGWAGTTYLSFGVLLTTFLFPHHVAALSLLFLAFADPVASYVGVQWGKDKLIGKKSLQGTISAFLVCTLLSTIYLYHYNLMTDRLIVVALLSGFVGAISELIPIGKLDDNFSLPILSSLFLYFIFYIFSGF